MTAFAAIIEVCVIGRSAKVTAIDPDTGVEVSVIGPAHAARADLEALALAKLTRALATASAKTERPRPARRGRLV